MQAIKAVYDGFTFTPVEPIPIRGHYEVVITFTRPIDKVTKNPLRILREPDFNKVPTIGEWDGMIAIPDDFNEPLEDMMEYM